MNGQKTFLITQKLVEVLFYLFILLAGIVVCASVLQYFQGGENLSDLTKHTALSFEVMDLAKDSIPSYQYAPDQLAALQPIPHKYLLHVPYHSGLGYFHAFTALVNIASGFLIIWLLRRIFRSITLEAPYTIAAARLIRNIAIVLIATDIIRGFEYLVFNYFANQYFPGEKIRLITSVGNGIWLGLIILALSIVYYRGVEIYSENQLTI
ncbi:MAG: DUF2975 domain-containing protein [Bacteroidetes bacterium]|nr:DUF2975 domain-containing protein [Bacteroidota bacterium]